MNLLIVFVTITCVFIPGTLGSSVDHTADYLSNPKDDCGNICGQINVNITDSSCGDPDKRNYSLLLIHNQLTNDEERTEYYEEKKFECVGKCPNNLQIYSRDAHSFCVKNVTEFANNVKIMDKMIAVKDEKEQSDGTNIEKAHNDDDKSGYTWWIVGGSVVLVIAITSIVVIGMVLKKKSGNVDFELPVQSPRPIQML